MLDAFATHGMRTDTVVADEGFVRLFLYEGNDSLKIDFVNDVPFRKGTTVNTPIFSKTDTMLNILSNKLSALGRHIPKDVADIVFISMNMVFRWDAVFSDAAEKDVWVDPINIAQVLDEFPLHKLNEIIWTAKPPDACWFEIQIKQIIHDILEGGENSLHTL